MKIKSYLTANGITQTKFAEMLGITKMSVCRYCQGYAPDAHHMQLIWNLTNGEVDPNSFFTAPVRKRRGFKGDGK